MPSSSSTSARVIKLLYVLYLLRVSVLVLGLPQAKHRGRRIIDKPPTTPRPLGPLTSEEMNEMISGTESPHLFDYPDDVYMSNVVREGEWVKKPLPQKNTRNFTVRNKVVVKKKMKTDNSSVEMALASILGVLGI
ncbi:unnamed protein product [Orchesella dallaii]|uniref:Uncharacterized protein n=1 Tax=Orchesella dallaii TaxID=48710 RepID=A0ABP1QFZ0_9HEXA